MPEKKKRKRVRRQSRKDARSELETSLAELDAARMTDVIPVPKFATTKGKRSAKEKQAIRDTIGMLVARGYTDEEMADSMGVSLADVVQIKNAMVRRLVDQIKKTSVEETYARYVLQQGGILRQLSTVTEMFGGSKQFNALVGSLNSQSAIFDKVLKVGQDLGIIKRTAREILVIGGREIGSDVAFEEIEEEVAAEIEFIQGLVRRNLPAGKIKVRRVRRTRRSIPETRGGGKVARLRKQVDAAEETLDAEFKVKRENQEEEED